LGAVFLTDFSGAVVLTSLDNLDFNREALLGWIRWTLAALSKAEKAACRFLSDLFILAFFTNDLRAASLLSLRIVLTLSFRTFLIADLMIGIFYIFSFRDYFGMVS